MAKESLLAIDVGTQSVRAVVFDRAGHLLARQQVTLDPPWQAPQPGWAEQDAEAYWRAAARACQALWTTGDAHPQDIAGLALTTLRGTVVCADEQGHALRPAILWLDQRRAEHLPALGPWWSNLFALAGASALVHRLQQDAEANWLAEYEPAVWRRTARYVLISGYLTHRLVGEWVDAVACQVGYLPFDYRRQAWASLRGFQWKLAPVRSTQLPRLVAPGQALGALTPAAAQALGLRAGLPVIAAGADKACEVLGCGALAPDVAQLSFGTTATINTTQSRYVEVERLLPAYPAALPGAWNTEIQIYRGFWMVSWFKREFAAREQAKAAELHVPVESLFDALVQSVPPGAMGLTLQPYWSPGTRNPGPEAKGAIIGFGDVHTRGHLYRAILEGLAYGLRAGREQIEHRLHRRLRRVVVGGGGSQSDAAMQITADVFGLPVERPRVYETSALGAAINLAVGLGLYADHASAVGAMCSTARVFTPDAATVRLYDALYRDVYRPLYRRLKPLYRAIRRITGYPA
ncbi:MAG TPA: FGGY-family carbohydrate kinase [Nevskiaceae bacterium]|nr:FGGY-family carbohydrate kinase [Nevskiaceae bacterium]